MDSLTQITLGAACGEIAFGRKVGNRAMWWGAVGGTIPDLDVLANLVTDEMAALAFHRAITHSLFFAMVAPPVLGWLVHRIYASGVYRSRAYRMGFSVFWLLLVGVPLLSMGFSGRMFRALPLLSGMLVVLLLAFLLWRYYIRREPSEVASSWRGWTLVFFLSIFTHPILDACTAFGTQLYQPFSDFRVAWNNISVVDPLYTLPFLFFVILAGRMKKEKRRRAFYNWMGVGVSCLYLALTFFHKHKVNQVFEASLKSNGFAYERYMTAPTIFNNILWQGVAEGDTAYYHGFYSLLDDTTAVLEFNTFPKRHELLAGHEEDRAVKVLTWFSNGYYSLIPKEDGRLQYNDLRYGIMKDKYEKPTDFVFRFYLEEGPGGELEARQTREGAEMDGEAFRRFFRRVGGER